MRFFHFFFLIVFVSFFANALFCSHVRIVGKRRRGRRCRLLNRNIELEEEGEVDRPSVQSMWLRKKLAYSSRQSRLFRKVRNSNSEFLKKNFSHRTYLPYEEYEDVVDEESGEVEIYRFTLRNAQTKKVLADVRDVFYSEFFRNKLFVKRKMKTAAYLPDEWIIDGERLSLNASRWCYSVELFDKQTGEQLVCVDNVAKSALACSRNRLFVERIVPVFGWWGSEPYHEIYIIDTQTWQILREMKKPNFKSLSVVINDSNLLTRNCFGGLSLFSMSHRGKRLLRLPSRSYVMCNSSRVWNNWEESLFNLKTGQRLVNLETKKKGGYEVVHYRFVGYFEGVRCDGVLVKKYYRDYFYRNKFKDHSVKVLDPASGCVLAQDDKVIDSRVICDCLLCLSGDGCLRIFALVGDSVPVFSRDGVTDFKVDEGCYLSIESPCWSNGLHQVTNFQLDQSLDDLVALNERLDYMQKVGEEQQEQAGATLRLVGGNTLPLLHIVSLFQLVADGSSVEFQGAAS